MKWLGLAVVIAVAAYALWSPGSAIADGRHDRHANGMWLAHGWMGEDGWFDRNQRDRGKYRSDEKVKMLGELLAEQHVRYAFPHLCPASSLGPIPAVDDVQVERLLDGLTGVQVLPWVGGVYGQTCLVESREWRRRFVGSVRDLLERHPRLAGVQVNVEPMPSGDEAFLRLLEDLRAAMPSGKVLSVAAYPPPTRWHPHPDVHWEEQYFRAVAKRCDLMAVMMYDTGVRVPKLYEKLMADWTAEVLTWSGGTPVLLGIPAYDDADRGYHHQSVENVVHAVRGVHAGLQRLGELPANYRGIAVYSEWELDDGERQSLQREFLDRR